MVLVYSRVRPAGCGQCLPGHRSRHGLKHVRPRCRVKGGFYGEKPGLTDLDNGDLKSTIDFRDVYHELLATTLGADPTPSVGTGRRNLGFL